MGDGTIDVNHKEMPIAKKLRMHISFESNK